MMWVAWSMATCISGCRSKCLTGFLKQNFSLLLSETTVETMKVVRCWNRRMATTYNGNVFYWHYFICWLINFKQVKQPKADFCTASGARVIIWLYMPLKSIDSQACAFALVRLFFWCGRQWLAWFHPFSNWSSRVINWKLSWPVSCTYMPYIKCMR